MPDSEKIVFELDINAEMDAASAEKSIKDLTKAAEALAKKLMELTGTARPLAEVAKAASDADRSFKKIVDSAERYLGVEMEAILGKHAKRIREDLLPKDIDPAIVAKTYKLFLDEIKKQQARYEAGVRGPVDPGEIVEETIKKMKNALRVYRDEIAKMPKYTPLEYIAKKMAKEGQSIDQILRQVERTHKGFLKALEYDAEEAPNRITSAIEKSSAKLKAIPQMFHDLVYDKIMESFVKLPVSMQYNLLETVREIDKFGVLLRNAMADTAKIITEPFTKRLPAITSAVSDAFKSLVGIADKVGISGDKAEQAAGKIVGAVSPIPSKFAAIGRDAGNKLVGGINSTVVGIRNVASKVSSALSPIVSTAKDIGDRASQKIGEGMSFIGPKLQPIKDALNRIVDAWEPLGGYMLDVGRRAADDLIDGVKTGIEVGTTVVSNAVVEFAKKTGDALTDQFKYIAGGLGDILTFKDPAEKMRRAYARAELYKMPKTMERLRKEMNYYAVDIEDAANTTEYQMRVIRQSFGETLGNVATVIDSMLSKNLTFREGIAGLGTSFVQVGRVMGRNVGIYENMDTVQRRFGKTVSFVTKTLSGYRRENEILDPRLNKLAKTTDDMSDILKEQMQVFIKSSQMLRSTYKDRADALLNYLEVLNKIDEVQKGDAEELEKQRAKLAAQMSKALISLEDAGIARTLFGDMADDMDALQAKVKQFGTTAGSFLAEDLVVSEDVIKGAAAGINNEVEKMTRNFPKAMQMLNRGIMDVEEQSKHFITTLRDGGKISTERLQDVLLAVQNIQKQMVQMQKLGAVPLEMQGIWENMQRNMLGQAEALALMAQRAKVVEKTKEKLFGTTKKVTNAIISMGSAATKNIPIVGKNAKLSAEQMQQLNEATSKVSVGTSSLTLALGDVDPMFSDMAYGAQNLGQTFNSVMDGMASAAAVKTAAITKSLTLLKIAAVGVIGAFSGIIISTGKLAAEVTTLNMTMMTVGKNMGIPTEELEKWRETLKNTGITTRESINSITLWMRAGLPFKWNDAVSGMTYELDNLARGAQELAVAMGEDSSETFARFIDFIQSGNSNLLKTVGIMKTANQMYEEYAEALGTTVKSLSIRQKQEALISGLMRETTTIQGAYTAAMETANKQLGSMKRYIEELRLEWGKHFEPILVLVIKRFNELIKFLTDIPDKTKQTITTFIAIATAISGLVLGITVLLPKLKALIGTFKLLTTILTGKFGILLAIIGALAGIFSKWFMSLEGEGEGIAGIVSRIDTLLESLGGLKGALQPIMDWISSFAEMIKYHFRRISERVNKFVENIKSRIKEFMADHPEIAGFLERAKTVLSDLFSVIWRVVDQVLGAVEALLDQDWDKFFDKLKTAGQYILAWIFEFFNEVVKSAFEWGKNVISGFISGLVQDARVAIPRALTNIGNMIAGFLEGHSPPKLGPLSNIERWGSGLMGTFESSLRKKKILFDEGMFLGMSSLNAKARVWGDNITATFAAGITGRAASAVIPAMDTVGEMIARFLEGHSPPVAGRLAEIEDWGRNAFETFLSGFEMADYSILDQALNLVKTRIDNLVDAAKEAGPEIARAMMQVREAVAGAIFQARVTGGPLDLSGLQGIMVGTLEVYAADIAAVLEASFAAAEAQKGVQALQEQIQAAQQARQDAIQAAQDVLEGIQDQIKDKEDEVEALNEQMENEIETRAKAMGIFVDEKLMESLRRNLERANVEVDRAQRRLDRVRGEAGKYGMNILTWEEINANVQLQLAKDRQAQAQEQINYEEEKQRQMDELRSQIEQEYQGQFDALEAQIEALQERAEAQQENLEAMRKADQAASRAEQAQLRAAQQHAKDLAEHADLLSKALEARMQAEKEFKDAVEGGTGTTEETTDEVADPKKARRRFIDRMGGGPGESANTISDMLREWFAKMGIELQGSLPDIIAGLAEKLKGWWQGVLDSPLGEELQKLGIVDLIEQVITSVGGAVDSILGFIGNIVDAVSAIGDKIGAPSGLGGAAGLLKGIADVLREIVEVAGKAIEIFFDIGSAMFGVIEGILTGDWSSAAEGFNNFLGDAANLFSNLLSWFGVTGDEIVEWFAKTRKHIGDFFGWFPKTMGKIIDFFKNFPKEISKALKGLWNAIKKPFIDVYNKLVGRSLIPDLVNDILDWFLGLPEDIFNALKDLVKKVTQPFRDVFNALVGPGSIIGDIVDGVTTAFSELPGKIVSFAGDFLKSAAELGKNISDGISGKITEIKDNMPGWMNEIGDKIGDAAGKFWNKATEVAQQAHDAISSKLSEAKENMPGWMTNIANKISDAAGAFWNKATETITNVYNAIRDKLTGTSGESVSGSIVSWMTTIANKLVQAAGAFYTKAWTTANEIYNGFRDLIFGEDGLYERFGGWISSIADTIGDFAEDFYNKAYILGEQVGYAIRTALEYGLELISTVIKSVWNNVLREPFNKIIKFTCDMVNGVIDVLNDLWIAIGSPASEFFPIDTIPIPVLPELKVGGITTRDVVAQLHAGEVVLPLDRLEGIMRNMNIGGVPAFSPVMNFYPGSSPQQVMPAIHQAYDWYTEELRRG